MKPFLGFRQAEVLDEHEPAPLSLRQPRPRVPVWRKPLVAACNKQSIIFAAQPQSTHSSLECSVQQTIINDGNIVKLANNLVSNYQQSHYQIEW